jgi:hypothetical protein
MLTEFDGLYFVTDDREYKMQYRDIPDKSESKKAIKMIIIEVKHGCTASSLQRKIEQIKTIQQYIEYAKDYVNSNIDNNLTSYFKTIVRAFQFDRFTKDIVLYFGGQRVDENVLTYVKNEKSNLDTNRIYVNIIYPSGNRYQIRRHDEDYVNRNVVIIGGKKRTNINYRR